MNTSAFQTRVKQEHTRFTTALQKVSAASIRSASRSFAAAATEDAEPFHYRVGPIQVRMLPSGLQEFHFSGKTPILCADLDTTDTTVAQVRDSSEGAERQVLAIQEKSGAPRLSSRTVGPFVAIRDQKVQVLENSGPLWQNRLVRQTLGPGMHREVLQTEKDRRCNLTLIRGSHGCLFLLQENGGFQKLWEIRPSGDLHPLDAKHGVAFSPIGYTADSKIPQYWVRQATHSEPWVLRGTTVRRGPWERQGILHTDLDEGLVFTREHGRKQVQDLKNGHLLLSEGLGSWSFHPWAAWKGESSLKNLRWTSPGCTSVAVRRKEGHFVTPPCSKAQGIPSYHTTHSSDGTRVGQLLVEPQKRGVPRGLLCIVQGAQGLPTPISTARWKPQLEAGWALAFGFIRGGGDHDPAWAEAARREKKGRSMEDTDAVIRAAQKVTGVSPRNTVLQGRSAGGQVVGSRVAAQPKGELFGAAQTEVPQVDVLRTTTNPSLPLTPIEYNEFGDPLHRLADLETILRLSPVDALGPEGAPGVFVLCRTALHDVQVYPQESMKWVDALRGIQMSGSPKLLSIAGGQGHFTQGEARAQHFGEDFALLDAWVSSGSHSH